MIIYIVIKCRRSSLRCRNQKFDKYKHSDVCYIVFHVRHILLLYFEWPYDLISCLISAACFSAAPGAPGPLKGTADE